MTKPVARWFFYAFQSHVFSTEIYGCPAWNRKKAKSSIFICNHSWVFSTQGLWFTLLDWFLFGSRWHKRNYHSEVHLVTHFFCHLDMQIHMSLASPKKTKMQIIRSAFFWKKLWPYFWPLTWLQSFWVFLPFPSWVLRSQLLRPDQSKASFPSGRLLVGEWPYLERWGVSCTI